MNTLEIVKEVASIASFSSFEERLHPFLEKLVTLHGNATLEYINNSIIIYVEGRSDSAPVALTAHMDKINHFGEDILTELPVSLNKKYITGQLDDSVGVGICLSLLLKSRKHGFPPLLILLSEIEESYGLRNHPQLLKENGQGLYARIGSERIANHLIKTGKVPELVLTIDTSPLFQGRQGIALYSDHWEKNGLVPSNSLLRATKSFCNQIKEIYPRIEPNNKVNDYVIYGKLFNQNGNNAVPSIAIEPAIFPYHQIAEKMYVSDVLDVVKLLVTFLNNYNSDSNVTKFDG